MSLVNTLYYHLPYAFQSAAASFRGLLLERIRYGRDTERLVAEAFDREGWQRDQWVPWRAERLQNALAAARRAPFYKRAMGCVVDSEVLHDWPVLDKECLRREPRSFLSAGQSTLWLHGSHTSGSTGTPLRLWASKRALRVWYALFEARWRQWNGVRRSDQWAILGGQPVVPIDQHKPPYWVWNAAMRQLYISSYHIAPWSARAIVGEMSKVRVVYLWGYASALYELAREVLSQHLPPLELKVVISNAEPLFEWQREIIGRAFGCRVVNTYGMSEMVAGASECEYGRMHLWPEAGVVEVLDDEDCPVPEGEVGRLICTGLINDTMPLIRYEVGDRGALAPGSETCPCGRSLPILQSIDGRLDDVVVTPDGRRVGRLDTVFKADLPIRAAQIVQEDQAEVRVSLVAAEGFSDDTIQRVGSLVSERLGRDMRVVVEEAADIPRGPNGKRRLVISRLPGGNQQERLP